MNTDTIALLVLAGVLAAGCSKESGEPMPAAGESPEPAAAPVAAEPASSEIVPGLTMRVLKAGDGAAARAGQVASVHYTGWLYDPSAPNARGNKFDSSLDRGQPFQFPLGAGRVIRGWDQGVVGMQIGEVRELTIAPDLAYGDRQIGDVIPAGSTLVFEVELLGLSELQ